jgi:DNA primase
MNVINARRISEMSQSIKPNHQPEYIKYKKLRLHDPQDDKRKNISRFIGGSMMGEDIIQGKKEVIITEGAPDWISAIDHGFAAISPVTTNFKDEDIQKLVEATGYADSIYIINDNEANNAGYDGALRTGKKLSEAGKNVFIVELPRPVGTSKIDLNEYFLNNTADDLRKLMDEAKTIIEILIESLPRNAPRAIPRVKSDIIPYMVGLDDTFLRHYVYEIKEKTGISEKIINREIKQYKQKDKPAPKPIDPSILADVEKLKNDPLLIKKRLDTMGQAGIVGERGLCAMYFSVLDSRLLNDPLSSKTSGHSGSGKSHTLSKCLSIYPESAYHMITNGSPKSLYHMTNGLKNKAFIIAEGFQFQKNNATDSELVYVVRSLLSEGVVKYSCPQKNDDGRMETVEKTLEGPTSFITTTIYESLEAQLEDRMWTVHSDESVEQTIRIINMTALMKSGVASGLESNAMEVWKRFHESLMPVKVVIPYAPDIAAKITNEKLPISTRRAFNRVMSMIEVIACAYQHQRQKDEQFRVIAQYEDYHMACQIVEEAFKENMGQASRANQERLSFFESKTSVNFKEIKKQWGISPSAISAWVRKQVNDGNLVWCNEEGRDFTDDNELKKMKSSGNAYLKLSSGYESKRVTGLPKVFDITKDPEWAEGGRNYKLYDLELSKVSDCKGIGNDSARVFTGVQGVFTPGMNTHEDIQSFDNKDNSAIGDVGVQVFTPEYAVNETGLMSTYGFPDFFIPEQMDEKHEEFFYEIEVPDEASDQTKSKDSSIKLPYDIAGF